MTTPNKFNTTPDGTTVIDVNSVLTNSTTLVLSADTTPFIDNIMTLNPTITTFVFQAGAYSMVNAFWITNPGIQLLGMTGNPNDVIITQTGNADGIVINADHTILQSISVICQQSGQVCLTAESANNTVVSNCYFTGASDTFTIYYSGPTTLTQGASTLNGYANYTLDTGNVFYQNVIYTSYSGDSVSFSLQYNGQFVGNVIRGGRLAVYMCRTVNIYNNQITDSNSHGMYVSFPSDNLSIIGNSIYGSTYSAIKMSNQMEHGAFTTYPYNIIIQCNTLFNSGLYGLDLNYADGLQIQNNTLTVGQTMGIYMYSCTNTVMQSNKIAYFNYGFWLEASNNCTVQNNTIMSIYPKNGQIGVNITLNSSSITVSGNTIMGPYLAQIIFDQGTTDTVGTNPITTAYTYNNETSVYKVLA